MNKINFIDKDQRLRTRQTLAEGAHDVVRIERITRPRRPQLVGRWRVEPCTGRLFCSWVSQDAEEPSSRRSHASQYAAANGPAVARAA